MNSLLLALLSLAAADVTTSPLPALPTVGGDPLAALESFLEELLPISDLLALLEGAAPTGLPAGLPLNATGLPANATGLPLNATGLPALPTLLASLSANATGLAPNATSLPSLPTNATGLPTDLPTDLPTGLPSGIPGIPALFGRAASNSTTSGASSANGAASIAFGIPAIAAIGALLI